MTTETQKPLMDLWDFSKICTHGLFQPYPHTNLVIEFLHYIFNGQLENFAAAVSPRLGKSMEVSEIFPAYCLGMRPYWKIIHVSYQETLARAFGEKARDNLKEFGEYFPYPVELSESTKSKSWFKVRDDRGEYFCSGINGGIMGRGANIIIVDDPTKNIEEARSPRTQEKLESLFNTVINSRKEKDPYTRQQAGVVVIHQRLDKNDLIGIILQSREWITVEEALPRLRRGEHLGQTWVYLRLPELAEENDILGRQPGEALCPDLRTREELLQIKKDIGDEDFQTIYQQDPPSRKGKFFSEKDFHIVENRPQGIIQEVMWFDLAGTKYPDETPISQRGASTAGVKLALTRDRRLFITDLFEIWEEEPEVIKAITNYARLHKKTKKTVKYCIPQDPGQAGKGQPKHFLINLPGYNFEGIKETGNKEARAEAPKNWVKVNGIYVVAHPLAERFIKQCANFPDKKQKDFVDAFSGSYSELDIPEEEPEQVAFDPTLMGSSI
jgi:predicted phage terminase large subunit-like protein